MASKLSRRGVLGVGAGLPVAFVGSPGADAQTGPGGGSGGPRPSFTLLLVNDIYRLDEYRGRGGFARLATIVEGERARGVPVLFCHAGDSFSPSLLSGFDKGAHIVSLTNLIEPDVFVPGNHEFDFGPDVFMQRLAEARFPVFGANLRRADGSPVPGVRSAEIRQLGPVKVGVVGVIMEEVPRISHSGDLRFEPVRATLRREVAGLRAGGADIVVAVAHTDRAVDTEIVRSRLVDVLLSGHDHDLAIAYDGKTVMVESSEEGWFVTAIDMTVTVEGEGAKRRVGWSPSFRVHDSRAVVPHPDVLRVVRTYQDGLAGVLDVVVGSTTVALDSRAEVLRAGEAAIGNLVTDAMRLANGADVTIMNAGSFRAHETYAPGAILRRRDILSELPYGNTTVVVDMSGEDLRSLLEHGFAVAGQESGRFPQLSGVRLTYSRRAPPGSRLREVWVGTAPLDPSRRYRVAANDFMLAGGDGYTILARSRPLVGATDGNLLVNEVMAYVTERGTVSPAIEGRIVAVD